MAELMAEAEYMEKKKSLEFENLRIQLAGEVAKAKARVKILEDPSEVPDDTQATLKSKASYLDQREKREEVKGKSQKESEPVSTLRKRERCDANFIQQGKGHGIGLGCHLMQKSHVMKDYPRSYRNTLDPNEDDKMVHLARGCNFVEKGNIKEISSDALCKLLQLHAAPEVHMEQFDSNFLNYHYFMALFAEVVEAKIEEPRGRLTKLIKFTTEEARKLIKHCIQLPHNRGYQHTSALLERTYGNPHKILSSYWKEIKE